MLPSFAPAALGKAGCRYCAAYGRTRVRGVADKGGARKHRAELITASFMAVEATSTSGEDIDGRS
jgi:hypothetical protein